MVAGSKNKVVVKDVEIKKTKGNYCFPDFLGNAMSKVGQRVQFESSLLSVVFILLGILIMTIVTVFGTELSLLVKILAGVNGVAALLFLSSHLVTTFQQYQAYLSIIGILEIDADAIDDDIIEEETIGKKNKHLE